ncbi:MAG: 4'-phosphopantetheinyl transferase superfamily protein [Alphaproteobacteria bacterium]|nr:4'-phosphopantetheinyl transferase superfamily protein [Alphaproteobacteria bacterium]
MTEPTLPGVHVRVLPVDETEADQSALSPDERQRAARFAFAADRRQYVTAHGMARSLIAELLGADPAGLRFAAGGGKPRLIEPAVADLDLSLSHAAGIAACAVSFGGLIGIDVEPLARRVAPRVARRFLATDEAAWLEARPPECRPEDFLALWTLKEAFAKALGLGIQVGFGRFSLRPDPPRAIHLPREAGAARAWRFAQWRPTPLHVAALAWRDGLCGERLGKV